MTFNNRCYGLVVIRSENSNWNADFSGFPRRLPDEKGTIYATDKALKYAIRKYFIDTNETVFVWKSFAEPEPNVKKKKKTTTPGEGKEELVIVPRKLEERFNFMKKLLEIEGDVKKNPKLIFEVFAKCLDVKLFGITYSVGESNISLTGPLQISYGVNILEQNLVYANQILSPYRVEPKKKKAASEEYSEEARASTLGSEIKALTSYYVYDFVLNPKNITDHMEDLFKDGKFSGLILTKDDINKLKNALNRAATNLNTTSKIGNNNVMTLFVTLEENDQFQLPSLKNFVTICKNNDEIQIDLNEIKKLLEPFKEKLTVELFKNDKVCKIINHGDNAVDKWNVKDILK